MHFEAHRGVSTEAPENTMPAFQTAVVQGYTYIEVDPAFTKDGKCVILHDESLNRTCRSIDGDVLDREIKISDISYSEALLFDAGIGKAKKYKGTRIPLLSDVLAFAKKNNITVKIDNRIQYFNDAQTDILFDTVKSSGAKIGFTSSDIGYIKKIVSRFPQAEIHYDGTVDENTLIGLKKLLSESDLYVWLPVPSPATSFAAVEKANEELCALVKKYAKLGLWILSDEKELEFAQHCDADIIESAGQIKPSKPTDGFVDCHTHTHFSHDSKCDPNDSFDFAKKNGLYGFAITDHCDIEYCKREDVKTPIRNSVIEAKKLGEYVISGVELGEATWYKDEAESVIRENACDVILSSVHAVRYKDYSIPYSRIDFSCFSQDDINGYMDAYFDEMLEMINTVDFDILTHMTCPLRYICKKYGKSVDLDDYREKTDTILKEIIKRGIALEINTSYLNTESKSHLSQSMQIIRRYREYGGYLLTLGSDAHSFDRIAYGFEYIAEELRKTGFTKLFYYKKRNAVQHDIR